MTTFLAALLAFPTAIFTILLGVVLAYWLCVIVGAAGIDMLEGGAKAVSGHGHSHLHDAEAGVGLFAALGFGGIPITVSVSLVVFLSWSLSLVSQPSVHATLSMLPSGLVSCGLGLVCGLVGTVLGGLAVRPLRPVFIARRAPGREALMGRVCTISSGGVTAKGGHATFDDGAAGLILNVFCDKPNELKRGQPALILGYDAERGIYEVEPVDWLMPQEMEQLRDPLKAAALARARSQR
jgi:hypothetical protein